MAILEQPYLHKTITTLTGVFGSVFDEIRIQRPDGKTILVPLAYQIKRKSNVRNEQNPNPDAIRKRSILPRMGFKLTGLAKDNNRITNRHHTLIQSGIDRETANGINRQYNRVPYILSYRLDIKTKTLDDMLQIVEQILVYFNPSLTVTVLDNPDLNQDSAITIRLISSGIEDMSEGSFEAEDVLEASMEFELEGWIYAPTQTANIIKKVIVNYYDMNTGDQIDQSIEVPDE